MNSIDFNIEQANTKWHLQDNNDLINYGSNNPSSQKEKSSICLYYRTCGLTAAIVMMLIPRINAKKCQVGTWLSIKLNGRSF